MSGEEYVYAAYGVVLFALLLYVVVTGMRSARTAREAELLARLVERDAAASHDAPAADPVDVTRA
ncbi:MAG TPA: hypothetical protein PKD59_02845 [Miltoncostaeaceae bacterium]|nr:hypothetical protein [Miltoncostaeaceae bacterium]